MDTGTSAWGNLFGLFHCVAAAAGSGGCAFVRDPDSGFGIALVFVLALGVGGVVLTYMSLATVLGLLPEEITRPLGTALKVLSPLPALLWFYLWLAYALPECAGQSYVEWLFTSPLFTLVLMTGFVGMVAAAGLLASSALAPGRRPGGAGPAAGGERWMWGLLIVVVTGLLIGWHALYEGWSPIAAGPYGRGPGWFQDALEVWTLHLPVAFLWGLAQVLATVPGITAFALLGVVSVALPQRTGAARAARLASAVTTTAVGQVIGVVVSTCLVLVVGLLAIAALALAFMFFAAYVMAYALVLLFLGTIVVKVVRG